MVTTMHEGEVRGQLTGDSLAVATDVPLREVARQFLDHRSLAVVVDSRQRPVGLLSPADVLLALTVDPDGQTGQPDPARSTLSGKSVPSSLSRLTGTSL